MLQVMMDMKGRGLSIIFSSLMPIGVGGGGGAGKPLSQKCQNCINAAQNPKNTGIITPFSSLTQSANDAETDEYKSVPVPVFISRVRIGNVFVSYRTTLLKNQINVRFKPSAVKIKHLYTESVRLKIRIRKNVASSFCRVFFVTDRNVQTERRVVKLNRIID
jgi:hypothetical protein